MVRRWSLINNTNIEKNDFFSIKKLRKLKIFKKTIMLKRFNKKYSKTRRKAFTRLRHDSNLSLYHNIFKYWIKDYYFIKYYAKLQFSNELFINNFIFFNANFVNIKNSNIYFNWNFIFLNFSKKSTFILNQIYAKTSFKINSQKQHVVLSKGWTLSNLINEPNDLAFPSYSEYDNILYSFDSNNIQNLQIKILSFLTKITNRQIFLKLQEIYKIIIYLFYFL